MKLFKYSVLALALAAGFSSCSDDDNYTPGAASQGVYFPTDDALEVTLDRNASEFDVIVSRTGETAAATYGLTGTSSDNEAFTLPTSVSFAEGESTTTVKVGYDKDVMAMDKAYTVYLAFAEGTKLSNYGYESLEMSVTLPAPWKTVGKGMYRDQFLLVMSSISEDPDFDPVWECELQQHEIDPLRFRWVHPYGEAMAKYVAAAGYGEMDPDQYDSKGQYYLEFYCNDKGVVAIPMQSLGFQFFTDGVMYVCNEGGYNMSQASYEVVAAKIPELCGQAVWGKELNKETNEEELVIKTIFAPEKVNLVSFDPTTPKYYGGSGYQWWREGVDLKDYDIAITYNGVLTSPKEVSYIQLGVELGDDVAKAKVGVILTEDQEEAIAAVSEGTIKTTEITESTKGMTFAFNGAGKYTAAVVAYNEDGEEAASTAITFEVVDNSAPKEWQSIGMGTYTDMYVLPCYGLRDHSWPVALEQNTIDPTQYRWVHPYGTVFADYCLEAGLLTGPLPANQYDSDNVLYLNFTMKDGLIAVPVQATAVILGKDGEISGGNEAGLYLDGGNPWDVILQVKGEDVFNKPTMSGGKIVKIEQPADITIVNWAAEPEKYYGLNGDTGGVQWVANGAAGAPAKVAAKGHLSSTPTIGGVFKADRLKGTISRTAKAKKIAFIK